MKVMVGYPSPGGMAEVIILGGWCSRLWLRCKCFCRCHCCCCCCGGGGGGF